MSDLPETLRDLARRVDVRRPILPPPALAPALIAAAEELERLDGKVAAQKAAVDAIAADAAQRRAVLDRLGASMLAQAEASRQAVAQANAAEDGLRKLQGDMGERLARIAQVAEAGKASAAELAEMQRDAVALMAGLERAAPILAAASELLTRLRPFVDAAARVRHVLEGSP